MFLVQIKQDNRKLTFSTNSNRLFPFAFASQGLTLNQEVLLGDRQHVQEKPGSEKQGTECYGNTE